MNGSHYCMLHCFVFGNVCLSGCISYVSFSVKMKNLLNNWLLLVTRTCVLSNSGLSNATSKRPKLAFFRGKICPPQSQNCQNQILHISKINFYFGFRWYSRYSQCRLDLNLFEFLWRYVEEHGKRNWETGKNRNSHTSKVLCILLVCLITNRHLADHISEPYTKLTGKW